MEDKKMNLSAPDQKGQIFGKYSLGSGNVLNNPNKLYSQIDDPEAVDSYKRSIIKDLKKAGIPLYKLKDYEVMDVGTGRQAIAFYYLGAKMVKHYDISIQNVEKMKNFIKANSLENIITTECVDLMEYSLPKDNFDLVFLHGITPCFSNVGVGLKNCLDAVKPGGYISLYFYRSGTFFHFIVYLLRDLINGICDYKEYFVNSILLYSDDCQPNHFVSNIMDSLFSPNTHLYTPVSYIKFVEDNGFKIVSSSKLDPLGRDVDHTYAYPNVVLNCQKIIKKEPNKSSFDLLSPENRINQLDPKNYSDSDKEILQSIEDYQLLKKAILLKKAPPSVIMSITFCIYNFLQKIDHGLDRVIIGNEGEINHQNLQTILRNAKRLIEDEF